MFGMRQKLVFGFGGLLAILIIVSVFSALVLRRYSNVMSTYLRDNFRSVQYGERMKKALDHLDAAARNAMDEKVGAPASQDAVKTARDLFDTNLHFESSNVTVHPAEDIAFDRITRDWATYEAAHLIVTDPSADPAKREKAWQTVRGQSEMLQADEQDLIDVNLDNMVVSDANAKRTTEAYQQVTYGLVAVAVALAVVLVFVLGRSFLEPLRDLTRSAREIERGNLDLVVQVKSRDEIGQLAEAFNSMAARLRQFRRSDRARLLRIQRTTQLAVNSLPDAIAIVSPDGRVEVANDAAQKHFGLRPDTDLDLTRFGDLRNLYELAAAGEQVRPRHGYESAIQVLDDSGQEHFFLPQVVPIIDTASPDSQVIGVTLILADVTNLRRLDELKNGILSVVSHELKTPLTSIRLAVHLILEERVGPLTQKQGELLLAARDDSSRLQHIIENLLDMGKLQAGRTINDLKPMPARQLVANSIEPLESSYRDRGVKLTGEVSEDLPDVLVDPATINHVLSNLLANALKYTPPGGDVRVTARMEGAFVRFSVRDTGRGIPQQYVSQIFERFFRVPDQPSFRGAGLGLAIAKEIVDAHGGEIGVVSREGIGSTFSFTLPKVDDRGGGGLSAPIMQISDLPSAKS